MCGIRVVLFKKKIRISGTCDVSLFKVLERTSETPSFLFLKEIRIFVAPGSLFLEELERTLNTPAVLFFKVVGSRGHWYVTFERMRISGTPATLFLKN